MPEGRIKQMALNFSDTYCSVGCMPKNTGECVCLCVCVCVCVYVKNVTNSYHYAGICILSGRPKENRDYLSSLQL